MGSIKHVVVAVADRFFLLRPLVIVPAVTFFLLGYCQAGAGLGEDKHAFWLAVVSYAVLMGSV